MRRARWLLAGLAVLALGWAVAPHGALPVYDGVGFPDEPYRFVAHVAGSTATKAATTATSSAPVTRGVAGAISMNSAEQAPQVSVLVPVGRLQVPAGTSRVVLRATPQAPRAAPGGRYFLSNAYAIGATGAGVTLADKSPPATITLRAATAQQPRPSIERYAGGRWTPLTTVAVGRDIYQATLPSLGTYAVIGSAPLNLTAGAGAGSSGTSPIGIVIAVAAAVVVVTLIIVAVLRRRRKVVP